MLGIFGAATPAFGLAGRSALRVGLPAGRQERKTIKAACLRPKIHHILVAFVLLLLVGCDPTRRVAEGNYLLKRNHVVVSGKSVEPSELLPIIKQKPNKRILGVPFYLGLYNLRDPQKVQLKREEKDSLCAVKNEKRLEKGKKPRICDQTTRSRNGEPPVVLDSSQTHRSSEQLRLFMKKEGYFEATVSDSIHYTHRKWFSKKRGRPFKQPKAEVVYTIVPGPVSRLRKISYTVDDPAIAHYIQEYWGNTLLKTGDRFDADVLDAERTRVADRMKELGYLFFTRELVMYDANPTVGDHEVDLTMRIERPYSRTDRGLQGTPEGTIYTIGDISIRSVRTSQGTDMDTTLFQGYRLLHQGKLPYRPQALLSAVFLKPQQRFEKSAADNTYKRLTSLRVFDRVEISYDTTGTGRGVANARINLLPSKQQNMSIEGYGTNRGGFFGTTLSFGYRHRNLFKSLGYIQTQLNLGLEAQQSFTARGDADVPGQSQLGSTALFNTVNIGPEVTIGFPRPFARLFSKSSSSKLLINALYNFQQRPDFTRTLAKASIGMEWQESKYNTIGLFPIDVNIIKIPSKSETFNTYLKRSNDPVLLDSYTNHLIIGPRAQFIRNTQANIAKRNVLYLRVTGEWAPSLKAFGKEASDTLGNRFYTVGDIRYAEFVKVDGDLRWRKIIHSKSSVAFRLAAGIGVPYGNLPVLPFEVSFFGGGANGMRAWRSRTLGPGSYSAPLVAYDRIGEIRLEYNAEYRFKLIGFLEGALFADIGNIWNRSKDPRRPGADFAVDRFLGELAVGTGAGARFNFDFFIVRFDLGLQTKDPALPKGERWLFQPKDQWETSMSELEGRPVRYGPQLNFNLGIGYPF